MLGSPNNDMNLYLMTKYGNMLNKTKTEMLQKAARCMKSPLFIYPGLGAITLNIRLIDDVLSHNKTLHLSAIINKRTQQSIKSCERFIHV